MSVWCRVVDARSVGYLVTRDFQSHTPVLPQPFRWAGHQSKDSRHRYSFEAIYYVGMFVQKATGRIGNLDYQTLKHANIREKRPSSQ